MHLRDHADSEHESHVGVDHKGAEFTVTIKTNIITHRHSALYVSTNIS